MVNIKHTLQILGLRPLIHSKRYQAAAASAIARAAGTENTDRATLSMPSSGEGGDAKDLSTPKEDHLKVLVRVRPYLSAERGRIEPARIDIRWLTHPSS